MTSRLPLRQKAGLLGSLIVIGTIIATLGSISLPIGDKISNFWPGVVIQALGGLWFGWIGVLAGIVFPVFSNIFIGGNRVQIVGFIPTSIAQSGLPLAFYYLFKRRPRIANLNDLGFFIVFVALVPMLVAGLFGPAAFYVLGDKPFIPGEYPREVYRWAIIHFRTLLIVGVPMMIWVAPKALAARVIEPYWRENESKPSYHSLSIKLFLAMGSITLFPLISIGIYQIATLQKTEILHPNYMAVAITAAFFSLLVVSSILTDIVARPIDAIIGKIEDLSRSHLLDVNLDTLQMGSDRFGHISRAIDELFGQLRSYERSRAMQEISAQVAHDIRSPLAALDSVTKDVSQLPEEKRIMLRSAIGRIRDIANHLIEKNREFKAVPAGASAAAAVEPPGVALLSSHIDPLITEKRLQFRSRIGVEIESQLEASYGLFARIQPTEFKRVLSNLVNNSVEAMGEEGSVGVLLTSEDDEIVLRVQDTAKGIAREILAKLGERGVTHGKPGGSGLGLYHAKASVESWGGRLSIESEIGKGTTVTIRLPKAPPPGWFVSRLELQPGGTVAILDDDASIHKIWQGRFDSKKIKEHGIEVLHFSTPAELRGFARGQPARAREALYLTDYELLGHPETGLSLVEELAIGERAILITSRFEEKGILAECRRLKVRMIPKGLAGFVPISIRRSGPDAALLDDDALVRLNWTHAAKARGLNLAAFRDSRDFLAAVEGFPKDLDIYLDSKLGEGARGEEIAEDLHSRGYTNLYLTTGYDARSLPPMRFIKKVLGKEPPWA